MRRLGKDRPAIELATADCIGMEITGNRIFGAGGRLIDGAGQPLVAEENILLPFVVDPPLPDPAVPSIFEWQRTRGP